MEYETLLVERTEAVAKITVNRPDVLNAQSDVVIREMDAAFALLERDDDVRVVIVAGAGKHFSAGHDVGTPQQLDERARQPWAKMVAGEYVRERTLYVDATMRWRDFPKPTIAQVQGYCIMGGVIFATACDLIVAAEDAKFTDRTIRWGGAHVQYASLQWQIPLRAAKEYLFTGDFITAAEAYRLGLVNKVVPREKLDEETMALAQRIALNDPFALRMSKQSINAAQDAMGFRRGIYASFEMFMLGHSNMLRLQEDEWTSDRGNLPSVESTRKRDARFGEF